MNLVIKSSTLDGYALVVDNGIAQLEIDGVRNRSNKPYLIIEYVPPNTRGRIYSSYRITGCLLISSNRKSISTNMLLKLLNGLGFRLSSNALREAITPLRLLDARRPARASKHKVGRKVDVELVA